VNPAHARVPISHDFVGIRIECRRQRIDRQWNIVLRFCDIATIGDLLASEFDFLNNRVFSEDVTEGSWDTKFGEAWQEDFEWYRVFDIESESRRMGGAVARLLHKKRQHIHSFFMTESRAVPATPG
jgi:hypothetical protein